MKMIWILVGVILLNCKGEEKMNPKSVLDAYVKAKSEGDLQQLAALSPPIRDFLDKMKRAPPEQLEKLKQVHMKDGVELKKIAFDEFKEKDNKGYFYSESGMDGEPYYRLIELERQNEKWGVVMDKKQRTLKIELPF